MDSSGHPAGSPQRSIRVKRIIVYTSSRCPRCALLKRWLRNKHTDFEERNLEDVEVMANLVMKNIFVLSAPALEVEGAVYTEDQIFDGDGTVKSKLLEILEGK
ncbi:MAG: Glutaredoxin [Candidatus Bathyarchaeota archaeon BA1]|nr:MAG: Glutaredoxin [Candidatus Bathyarchaeota archaeon BA1]